MLSLQVRRAGVAGGKKLTVVEHSRSHHLFKLIVVVFPIQWERKIYGEQPKMVNLQHSAQQNMGERLTSSLLSPLAKDKPGDNDISPSN